MADKKSLSVTDITKCKDCNGMYDPCNHHLARVHELSVGQWEVTGNVSKQDLPRNTRYYTLTDHAQSRMGSRHLNKKLYTM